MKEKKKEKKKKQQEEKHGKTRVPAPSRTHLCKGSVPHPRLAECVDAEAGGGVALAQQVGC